MTSNEAKTVVTQATQDLDAAQSALGAANAAYQASPTDKAWSAVEKAESIAKRRAADMEAATRRLHEVEAVEAAHAAEQARAADATRIEEIRAILSARPISKHVDAFIEAERTAAAAATALQHNIGELAALRAEAGAIASRLGVETALPVETTYARVKALVSVAEGRTPTPLVALPVAPTTDRERVAFLCELLGESPVMGDEAERAFPYAERAACLLDGTYRDRKRVVADELKAEEATRQAAQEAKRRAEDAKAWARDQGQYPRFRSI